MRMKLNEKGQRLHNIFQLYSKQLKYHHDKIGHFMTDENLNLFIYKVSEILKQEESAVMNTVATINKELTKLKKAVKK